MGWAAFLIQYPYTKCTDWGNSEAQPICIIKRLVNCTLEACHPMLRGLPSAHRVVFLRSVCITAFSRLSDWWCDAVLLQLSQLFLSLHCTCCPRCLPHGFVPALWMLSVACFEGWLEDGREPLHSGSRDIAARLWGRAWRQHRILATSLPHFSVVPHWAF